jgi:hypothetical protein
MGSQRVGTRSAVGVVLRRVLRVVLRAVEVWGMASGDVRAVRRRKGKSRTRWWRW